MVDSIVRFRFDFFLWICFLALFTACEKDPQEPDVVAVTGVSLNESTLSLIEGRSVTLSATIIPEDATNQKVFWESGDSEIATVDANGKVKALKPGVATISVITEDGGKKAFCEMTVEPGNPLKQSRTVLVYVAADNSLSGFALKDLEEMNAGMAKVEDAGVHLLVYIDKGKNPQLLELVNENGTVVEKVVKTYPNRNSVGVAETQEVFAEVFSNSRYQADSYGLVYWSHGEGWLPYPLGAKTRWVGQDTGDGDKRMNISEFVEILETAPHLDFILFDACFMQSVEVAYELRHYTDYCIGSPTEIPGPGASYDALVPALFYSEDAAVDIAKAYYEPYAANYDGGSGISNTNWTGGASICALRTEPLAELAALTSQILPEMADNALLRNSVFDYDQRWDGHVGYYDLIDMMQMVVDGSTYETWRQALEAAVVYWATTPKNYSAFGGMFSMEGANGISCYIPSASNTATDKAYRSTEWYVSAGFEKMGW